jgi:hypothetical protein
MCGSAMRLTRTQTVARIPGYPDATTGIAAEWVCPECDYFEEAEEKGT